MSVDLTVWPPRYDRAYRPDPAAEYWFPELECCDPGTRDGLILEKLRRQVEWAWRRSPFYRRKWEAAGGSPATLHSDRKSTRLNSSHSQISYAVFCLKKKTQ